jgi:hypothetical protein
MLRLHYHLVGSARVGQDSCLCHTISEPRVLNSFQNAGVIAATVAVAAAFLLLVHRFWHSDLRRPHNDLIGWHITVIGSTYAVIIGFMLYAVWTNFEIAQANAEAEANCLVNVVRSSNGLSSGPHMQIRRLALEYVNIMLTEEWFAMEREQVSPTSQKIVQQLWATVTSFETHSGLEQTSLDHTFSELARMTEYRRLRQLQMNSYLPGILWLVLITGATITIVSACLFGAIDLKLHLIQVMMLALMVSSVLVAIADINRPFQGSVHVNSVGFEHARTTIGDFK